VKWKLIAPVLIRAVCCSGSAAQCGLRPPRTTRFRDHTQRRATVGRTDSFGRLITSSQRPLPDNTQHTQQTNIRAPGGIRTHDRSRRAAVDLCLRLRGHWDRNVLTSRNIKMCSDYFREAAFMFIRVICLFHPI
jgi:hypothetical protein